MSNRLNEKELLEKLSELLNANDENCGCCGVMDYDKASKAILEFLRSVGEMAES